MRCELCEDTNFVWSNVGIPNALECTHCGTITAAPAKPWVEITKGQIDDCLQHSDNYGSTPYDFAWAIEHICRLNNGYPAHENFKPAVTKSHKVSGSIKWSKPQ